MNGDAPTAFVVPPGVLAREVDGEMVLLNLNTEQYYGLDAVGTEVVNRLTRLPMAQAIDELCRLYEVEPAILRADVARLIDELLESGLLERTRLLDR